MSDRKICITTSIETGKAVERILCSNAFGFNGKRSISLDKISYQETFCVVRLSVSDNGAKPEDLFFLGLYAGFEDYRSKSRT